EVTHLAFSPDAKWLASGEARKAVLWDLATRKPRKTWDVDFRLRGLAFSPDGKLLAVGAGDALKFWDPESFEPRGQFDWRKEIRAIAFAPDQPTVYVATGSENLIRPVDFKTLKDRMPPWKGHKQYINALSLSRDGKLLASGGPEGVLLWDTDA